MGHDARTKVMILLCEVEVEEEEEDVLRFLSDARGIVDDGSIPPCRHWGTAIHRRRSRKKGISILEFSVRYSFVSNR